MSLHVLFARDGQVRWAEGHLVEAVGLEVGRRKGRRTAEPNLRHMVCDRHRSGCSLTEKPVLASCGGALVRVWRSSNFTNPCEQLGSDLGVSDSS